MGKADREYANLRARQSLARIDESEAVLRMIEAGIRMKRPKGKTVKEILENPETLEDVEATRRQFRALMEYWRECLTKGVTHVN